MDLNIKTPSAAAYSFSKALTSQIPSLPNLSRSLPARRFIMGSQKCLSLHLFFFWSFTTNPLSLQLTSTSITMPPSWTSLNHGPAQTPPSTEYIYSLSKILPFPISFTYVPAHKGHHGNELADTAAKAGRLSPNFLHPTIPKCFYKCLVNTNISSITQDRWNSTPTTFGSSLSSPLGWPYNHSWITLKDYSTPESLPQVATLSGITSSHSHTNPPLSVPTATLVKSNLLTTELSPVKPFNFKEIKWSSNWALPLPAPLKYYKATTHAI